MYAQFDISLMLQYLKNKGYKQDELSAMSDERILKLYQDIAREFILQAQDVLETSPEHENLRKKSTTIMPETIALIGRDLCKLYEEIDNYIDLYSVRELANLLLSALPGVKLAKVEKMVRIKIRELQEIWLLELKDNLSSLPEEERDTLMEYYLARKDDLPMLRDIYQKSKDPAYLDEICDLAHIKLSMIKEYMPDELESNYKSFYDHSPEKLSVIQSILALTAAYSKGALLGMSIKELQEMLEELQEKEQEQAEQKALVDRYFERFKAALHDPDDQHFTNVCLDAASELPRPRFQELATELSRHYKHFHQRFSDVSKEYKDMQNLQIVF
ncbi:hypothetical protein NYG90_04840 [Helicobacter sp. XJK30-2]|uniref:Uncharacterized protein n=1 Tax=Helicobacter zhangjianzhongii TaxID=2974574 RepID=A0ACC6FS90_9HELI|nr:hypothetical protein [Helicobacter sp. XJK30-2]MDL0082002.1 hypothetical protein [Helicobacter sp. XJK30-2]